MSDVPDLVPEALAVSAWLLPESVSVSTKVSRLGPI